MNAWVHWLMMTTSHGAAWLLIWSWQALVLLQVISQGQAALRVEGTGLNS